MNYEIISARVILCLWSFAMLSVGYMIGTYSKNTQSNKVIATNSASLTKEVEVTKGQTVPESSLGTVSWYGRPNNDIKSWESENAIAVNWPSQMNEEFDFYNSAMYHRVFPEEYGAVFKGMRYCYAVKSGGDVPRHFLDLKYIGTGTFKDVAIKSVKQNN